MVIYYNVVILKIEVLNFFYSEKQMYDDQRDQDNEELLKENSQVFSYFNLTCSRTFEIEGKKYFALIVPDFREEVFGFDKYQILKDNCIAGFDILKTLIKEKLQCEKCKIVVPHEYVFPEFKRGKNTKFGGIGSVLCEKCWKSLPTILLDSDYPDLFHTQSLSKR